ncbi:nucleoside 2-deoxyribosyltransferase [Paraburkholderia sp. SOS3]|jgi:nucleoside 2-deoxyribosyltransferase|uniref:nucleoside 2-deoxyribosyltransferase n=1 Tax=Paraburkholderia sp. SOS3 TaxID=1926494 RepID=UPI0009476624|nr:nucleoside 2-deoxyribosyltransferase [Paraburkholderia sp. SOS3]APR37172.1 nucleoside 2-deoxyribosyltransferase [Paraburkholderia sp. SOS3]
MQVARSATRKSPQIYLAGFDVFRPDAAAHGEQLKALCIERGLTGLYPSDGGLPAGLDAQVAARWICDANLALIRAADAVMANLNDFRGAGEPDAGTAFEVGFAIALGKRVWGYRSDGRPLVARAAVRMDAETAFCSRGFVVEDFGLPLNLMLACTVELVIGDAAGCLDAISEALGTAPR